MDLHNLNNLTLIGWIGFTVAIAFDLHFLVKVAITLAAARNGRNSTIDFDFTDVLLPAISTAVVIWMLTS